MMRLTNQIKRHILKKVIEAANYSDKENELIENEQKWAREKVLKLLPDGFSEVAKLHPDWFYVIDRVYTRGDNARNTINGGRSGAIFVKGFRVPAPMYHSTVYIEEKSPFLDAAIALMKDKEDLIEKVNGCLNSCTTIKALVRNYPEIEKFVPSISKGTALVVPSQVITDVFNKHGI